MLEFVKARPPKADRIYSAVQRLDPRLRRAFLAAVERLRGRIDVDALAQAIEAGDIEGAMQVIGADTLGPEWQAAGLTESLQDSVRAGAAVARQNLPDSVSMFMRFDLVNPRAAEAIRRNELRLIREVTDETRAAVREVVQDAVVSGGNPRVQARTIKQHVGLTRKQSRALRNFRDQLEQQTNVPGGRSMQPAGSRRLNAVERRQAARQVRDGGMTQADIDSMVRNYERRLTRLRAETIARTETQRAAAEGQLEQWRQAAEQGLLDISTVRRKWITAGDERVRSWHADIPFLNPDGVKLDEDFVTEFGPVAMPPAGPNCRCTVILEGF